MHATDDTYEQMTAGNALVAFYADWDAGFRRNRPAVEAAAKERGLRLVLVNIDHCPRVSVIGVPEFWLVRGGVRIARRVGTFAYGEGGDEVTSGEVERWLDS